MPTDNTYKEEFSTDPWMAPANSQDDAASDMGSAVGDFLYDTSRALTSGTIIDNLVQGARAYNSLVLGDPLFDYTKGVKNTKTMVSSVALGVMQAPFEAAETVNMLVNEVSDKELIDESFIKSMRNSIDENKALEESPDWARGVELGAGVLATIPLAGTGMLSAAKLAKIPVESTKAKLLAGLTAETVGTFFVARPDDTTLANIFIDENTDSESAFAIREFFATDPLDSDFENKLAIASEVLGLSVAGGVAILGTAKALQKPIEKLTSALGDVEPVETVIESKFPEVGAKYSSVPPQKRWEIAKNKMLGYTDDEGIYHLGTPSTIIQKTADQQYVSKKLGELVAAHSKADPLELKYQAAWLRSRATTNVGHTIESFIGRAKGNGEIAGGTYAVDSVGTKTINGEAFLNIMQEIDDPKTFMQYMAERRIVDLENRFDVKYGIAKILEKQKGFKIQIENSDSITEIRSLENKISALDVELEKIESATGLNRNSATPKKRNTGTARTGEEARSKALKFIEEQEAIHPEYVEYAKRVEAFNNRMLDYVNDMGGLTTTQYESFKDNIYAPLYRVENLETSKGVVRVSGGRKPLSRKLTGQLEEDTIGLTDDDFKGIIEEPLDAYLQNITGAIRRAEENAVFNSVIDLIELAPDHLKWMEPVKTRGKTTTIGNISSALRSKGINVSDDIHEGELITLHSKSFKGNNGDTIAVIRDGEVQEWVVKDELLGDMIRTVGIDFVNAGEIYNSATFKTLTRLTSIPRYLITRNPAFATKMAAMDSFSSFFYSESGMKPLKNTFDSVLTRIKGDELYQEFLANGGAMSGLTASQRAVDRESLIKHAYESIGIDPSDPNNLNFFEQIYRTSGAEKGVKKVINVADRYDEILENIENVHRFEEYKRLVKSGVEPVKAAIIARDVSLDFGMKGSAPWIRGFSSLTNFFNANVQAVYRNGRLITGKGITTEQKEVTKQAINRLVTVSYLFAVAEWAANKDNDHWMNLNERERSGAFRVYLPGDTIVTLPAPFELAGVGKAVQASLVEYSRDQNKSEIGEAFLEALGQTALGMVRISGQNELEKTFASTVLHGFTPTLVRPPLEYAFNENFMGSPILHKGEEDLIEAAQFDARTKQAYRRLSELTGDNMSPKALEFYMRSFLAGLPDFFIGTHSRISGDDRLPASDFGDMPVVSNLLSILLEKESTPHKYTAAMEKIHNVYEEVKGSEESFSRLSEMSDSMSLKKLNELENDPTWHSMMEAQSAIRGFFTDAAAFNEERDRIYNIPEGTSTEFGVMDRKLRKTLLDDIQNQKNETFDIYLRAIQNDFPELIGDLN